MTEPVKESPRAPGGPAPRDASATGAGSHRYLHLVGLLTFASGSVDVISLLALGGTFTSVVTGNLIFIGRAIGSNSGSAAFHAGLAVVGYILGVGVGSRLARATDRTLPKPPWPVRATVVLIVEWALLAAINIAWIAYDGKLSSGPATAILLGAAVALGMQSAVARAIDGTPSTTYMTGALTNVIEAIVTGQPRQADPTALIGLLTLVAGAACSALLFEHARALALLPSLLAVGAVAIVKLRHHAREREQPALPARYGAGGARRRPA
jgi:uncharacterized membrane protein YoaK (UPF0700 family)